MSKRAGSPPCKGGDSAATAAAAPAAPGTPVRRYGAGGEEEEIVYTPGLTSVGTLIVRIVAARNLPAATAGGFFSSGSSNPYCILEFEGHTQATSVVPGTLDPIWPREQYFFEVKMPAMHAESDDAGYYSSVSYHTISSPSHPSAKGKTATAGAKGDEEEEDDFGVSKGKAGLGKLSGMFSSSEPHLHVMLVHTEKPGTGSNSNSPSKPGAAATAGGASAASAAAVQPQPAFDPSEVVKPGKGSGAVGVPPGDKLLGEAFVNVVDLATARAKSLDEWFPLSEGGAVRLVVEYDVIEPPPQPGEVVRLLGFGSASDLWPLPLRQEMVVERYVDANRDRLLVAYDTSEGWRCRAEVHRFHVISAGRHQTLVNEYQNRLLDAGIALQETWGSTPAFEAVGAALDRWCEGESLGVVAEEAVEGFTNLLDRWFEGGLSTISADVKYALKPKRPAGFGGEAKEGEGEGGAAAAPGPKTTEEEDIYQDGFSDEEEGYQFDFIPAQELQRICCPITGLPMRDPVLAADGQAYERSAIQRWLAMNDTSPVTGVHLRTLELYDCRAMRETVEEFRQRNDALRRKAAAVITKGVFSRPGSRASNASGGGGGASSAAPSPTPSGSQPQSRQPSPAPLPPPARAAASGAGAAEAQRTALSASPLPVVREGGAQEQEQELQEGKGEEEEET